jgi:hypothetical protein
VRAPMRNFAHTLNTVEGISYGISLRCRLTSYSASCGPMSSILIPAFIRARRMLELANSMRSFISRSISGGMIGPVKVPI